MKDLGSDNLVHTDALTRVARRDAKPAQLVRAGDLVFRSRGQNQTVALLAEEPEATMVAAPLLRIRPDPRSVVPEYLFWWVNQPSSQRYLASNAKGTSIPMVSKQAMENLEVVLPPMDKQAKIAEIFRLACEEQRLAAELVQARTRHIHGILSQIAQGRRQAGCNRLSA